MTSWERSWVVFPRLIMKGFDNEYTQPIYSQEQRAYIIPGDHNGSKKIVFKLGFETEEGAISCFHCQPGVHCQELGKDRGGGEGRRKNN